MQDMMCIRCHVKGQVQGVWFRQSTVNEAKKLNITGYTKNLSNGDVEVIACGTEDDLDALKSWLWKGPPAAEVTELLVESINTESFSDFSIQH